MCLCDLTVYNDLSDFYGEKDTERFTCAPSVGHWPVCFSLLVWKPEKLTRKVLDYSKVDSIYILSALEVAIRKEYPDLIKSFPSKLFQSLNDLIQDCNKMMPTKTISSHSKPYCNAKVSVLSLQIKTARTKLRTNFTPQYRVNLVRLKYEMREEINFNNNLWAEKTIGDLNDKYAEKFFKAVERFNQPKINASVPMLINNKESLLTPKKKTKLFENIYFFRGGHFNDNNYDENFLTEGTSVAPGTATGNVEQNSLSDSLLHVKLKNHYGRTAKSN